jgi:hypothetical protein
MGRPEEEGMRPGDNDVENLVRRCVERKRFEKVACRQRGDEDSTAALTKGVAGYWRSVFTACDRHSYKQIAGDLLVELGYESTKNSSYRRRGHTPAGGIPASRLRGLRTLFRFSHVSSSGRVFIRQIVPP